MDLELIKTENKGFSLERDFLNDGANYQAQAVLAWLRGHLWEINDFCYKEKINGCDISCVRYENCREQGYIVSLWIAGYEKSFHYAFYEHRNSDNICIVRFEKPVIKENAFTEEPTAEDVWNNMSDKFDTTAAFGYGEIERTADWIIDSMIDDLSELGKSKK